MTQHVRFSPRRVSFFAKDPPPTGSNATSQLLPKPHLFDRENDIIIHSFGEHTGPHSNKPREPEA